MINKILKEIDNATDIAIFAHINADADALGSSIAFKLYLESLGKNVTICIDEPIHKNFDFLNIAKHINVNKLNKYDLAICLDCPNVKRFGSQIRYYYRCKRSINIDHHIDNENYAKVNYVNSKMSSTCSILYAMFKKIGCDITNEMATCLYAGIVGDTGRFKYNTTSNDLTSGANLLKLGADIDAINYNLFSRMSINEFKLLQLALSKTQLLFENKVACIFLTIQDLINSNCEIQDTHFLIDYLMNIDSVKLAVVLSQEKHDECKVSVRSKDEYSAQNVAKYFGGGGHIKASGCRIFNEFDKAINDMKNALEIEVNRCKEL